MKKIFRISVILLALIMLYSFAPSAMAAKSQPVDYISAYLTNAANVDHTTYGWARKNAFKNADGSVTLEIMEVPNFEIKTYTTLPLNTTDYSSPATGVTRADALVTVLAVGAFAEIKFNSNNECIDMEVVEYSSPIVMDSASYGGELTAKGGGAGNMVAAGWVLDKFQKKNEKKSTITIGDGNHYTNIFEQTYTLANDAKIYVVDSATKSRVKMGTFDDIMVTQKQADGEIYYTPERWQALCIFDCNYKIPWQNGRARVKELYIFSTPTVIDAKKMVTPDGMQYSGTSWYPLKSRAEEETDVNYAGSAKPIEFMKGRLYAVGDNYTSVMLYVGDDGTTSLMDMGNPDTRYQYYLNVEKVGYDPRSIDNIFLTHGHFDHYAAFYEFCTMIRRGGNKNFRGWINPYAMNGNIFTSPLGNTYSMSGTLTDKSVLYAAGSMLQWHAWTNILGLGADMYVWPAMGHSTDVASFVFKMTATAQDAYFRKGDIVSFLYFGGYAVQQQLRTGAMRLALVNSLQYQAQIIVPWAAAQSDYIYPLCQHTNQVSMLEIAKASEIAGIPFMKGYVGGAEEVGNYCENRIANMTYQSYNDAYEDDYSDNLSQILRDAGLPVPDAINWDLMPAAAPDAVYVEGTRGTKRLDTIEKRGPWKRPDGNYNITIKSVQVVHGYDAFMNKNQLFEYQTNVYGFTLDQGFAILWDTYPHDPDGWFVQVYADVDDLYDGGVDFVSNWNTPEYYTNYDNRGDRKTTWISGPVELCNPMQSGYEFLRLPRFDTQWEAEAYAKALTNGTYKVPYEVYNVDGGVMYRYDDKANHELDDFGSAHTGTKTYNVNLTKWGQIVLGSTFEETFQKVAE